MGQRKVLVVGVRNQAAHEGRVDWGSPPKTEPQRLGFCWRHVGVGSYFGRGDLLGGGEIWFEGVGVINKLQEGKLELVVLTFCLPIPTLSPIYFVTPHPLYPHLYPPMPQISTVSAVHSRWVAVEG